MTISEKVKTVRERSKLTQVEFAERLKVTQSGISLIEKGINTPSFEFLIALVKEMDVNAWFLLSDDDDVVFDKTRGLNSTDKQQKLLINKAVKSLESSLNALKSINSKI
jgi:transcriptional regulator with XRE-family HTH domain